jgi:hypothetical protein
VSGYFDRFNDPEYQWECRGSPRRCPRSWYFNAISKQQPLSSCPTVDR